MTGAPAAAAVLADVLWCLGLGCLLGTAREVLGLTLGNGPVRCLCWDLLASAAAAVLVCGFSAGVSASGLARWYMAAALAIGVLAWRQALQPALRGMLRKAAAGLLWPLRTADRWMFAPLRRRLSALRGRSKRGSDRKKIKKTEKNGKKQLQKPSKIVYN